eukprot:2532389-Pleurochrysis_carterae.AAC.3
MEWTTIPEPPPDPAPPPDQARAQDASQTNVRAKWARKDHETGDGRLSSGSCYASFAAHASRSLLGAIFSPTKAQFASANSSSGHAAFSPAEHAAHASIDASNTTNSQVSSPHSSGTMQSPTPASPSSATSVNDSSIKPPFPPSQTCERQSPSRTHTDAELQGSESPTPENVDPFTAQVDAETRAPVVGPNSSKTERKQSSRTVMMTMRHWRRVFVRQRGDLAAEMDEVEEIQEHDEKDDDAW